MLLKFSVDSERSTKFEAHVPQKYSSVAQSTNRPWKFNKSSVQIEPKQWTHNLVGGLCVHTISWTGFSVFKWKCNMNDILCISSYLYYIPLQKFPYSLFMDGFFNSLDSLVRL